jgi:hypothetical protein
MEEGIATVTVVVGTEDEPAQLSRGQSQQIMAPRSGRVTAFGRAHLNGSNGFIENTGRTIGLFAGGGFATLLRRLCHRPDKKGGKSGGWKSWDKKV